MSKTKIITIIILITTILLVTINPIAKATINPDDYNVGDISTGTASPVTSLAKIIVNTLAVIGIVISVIALIIMGLKYMMGSVEEKAEYKKTMIPYIVGVFMIVGITQFLRIIVEIVKNVGSLE